MSATGCPDAGPPRGGRGASTLVTAYAAGLVVAAVVGGALATADAWRAGPALSAALLLLAAVRVRALGRDRPAPPATASIAALLRRRRTLRLVALGGLWGATVLGGVTLLAPLLVAQGAGPSAGWLLVPYGLTVMATGALRRRRPERGSRAGALARGGACAAAGFAMAAAFGLPGAAAGVLVVPRASPPGTRR